MSIGTPVANTEVFVLDENLDLAPRGASGELCVGGIGLARGYVGDPARTAAAFVPHPTRPGQRVYRTGDIGRLRPDGSLSFLGRVDRQIKVRGVRIEPGEVESAFRDHPAVADVAVAAGQVADGTKVLVGYVVIADRAVSTNDLRQFVTGRLPAYAIPTAIVALDTVPRLANGKLDVRALPAPVADRPSDMDTPPRTATERAVADIWARVVGRDVDRIGVHDNFFAIGGHSLLVSRVVNRLRDAFDLDIPLSVMFEFPTVAGVAEHVEGRIAAEIDALSPADVFRLTGE